MFYLPVSTAPVFAVEQRGMPASIEAKGFNITIASRPLAALIWRQADETVWVATIDDEYAGIAELDNGRFRVFDNHSRFVGTVPTIVVAGVLLQRSPSTVSLAMPADVRADSGATTGAGSPVPEE